MKKKRVNLLTFGASCFVGGFAPFGLLMLKFQHHFFAKIAESGLHAPKAALFRRSSGAQSPKTGRTN